MDTSNNNKLQADLTPDVYEAITKALSDSALFSVTDEKGDIIYANEKFVHIAKYPLEELLGQNHRILKSGQQPQEIFDKMWADISSGKIFRGEVKNRAKDGTYYWVDATVVPILGQDGKPKNYAALRIPITDKKDLEEKDKKHLDELEKMNKFTVDRELRMVELKARIKELEAQLVEVKKQQATVGPTAK